MVAAGGKLESTPSLGAESLGRLIIAAGTRKLKIVLAGNVLRIQFVLQIQIGVLNHSGKANFKPFWDCLQQKLVKKLDLQTTGR